MPRYNAEEQGKKLLEQVTETLRTQKLTNQMQKELALLLLLRSILEEENSHRDTQKIKIVDLAISSLLQHQEVDEKNKIFIQQIRKKLDYESAEPNPLWAVLKGHGGAYNRLISGLTWYFILFVFLPCLAAGGIFFVGPYFLNITGEKADYQRVNNQENKLKNANEINSILRVTLDKVNLQVDSLSENKGIQGESNPEKKDDIKRIEQINNDIKKELKSTNKLIEKTVNKEPEAGKISDDDLFKRWFISQDIFFIYLAVSMGALGSITSLVVRSKKYIEQSEEEEKDLFFVGFLHPFVGMSFALFTVALIESGIFLSLSGITNNSTKETENRERTSSQIYYYMAIAFIAGFSERLVQDLVSKVEKSNDEPQQSEDDDSRKQERKLRFDDEEIN